MTTEPTTTPKKRPPTHGIACSEELWQRLRDYAASLECRTPNWVAVRALTAYLDERDGKGPAPKA